MRTFRESEFGENSVIVRDALLKAEILRSLA